MLSAYVDKVVHIVTNDGRNILGLLKGFDQLTNCVLDDCHERVFSEEHPVEQVRHSLNPPRTKFFIRTYLKTKPNKKTQNTQVMLGLYIVKGDNM